MSAEPLSLREIDPWAAPTEARFTAGVRDLVARHSRMWWQTPSDPPVLGSAVSRSQQNENARECERLIDDVARRIERYPESPLDRRRWRQEVKEAVRRFGQEHLAWPEGYRELLFDDAF